MPKRETHMLVAQAASNNPQRAAQVRGVLQKHGFSIPNNVGMYFNNNLPSQGGGSGRPPSVQVNPNIVDQSLQLYGHDFKMNEAQKKLIFEAGTLLHEYEHVKQAQQFKTDAAFNATYEKDRCKYEVPAEKKRYAFLSKAIPGFTKRFPNAASLPEYGTMCQGRF
jgi:hypothetical protein